MHRKRRLAKYKQITHQHLCQKLLARADSMVNPVKMFLSTRSPLKIWLLFILQYGIYTMSQIILRHVYVFKWLDMNGSDQKFYFQCFNLLVGQQEGHPGCIKLGVGLLGKQFDCRLAYLVAPVVTTTSIILSSNKTVCKCRHRSVCISINGPLLKRSVIVKVHHYKVCYRKSFE